MPVGTRLQTRVARELCPSLRHYPSAPEGVKPFRMPCPATSI